MLTTKEYGEKAEDIAAKYLEKSGYEIIEKNFPLKPAEIIDHFNLKVPIYKDTASYGHFGNINYPWEKIFKLQ